MAKKCRPARSRRRRRLCGAANQYKCKQRSLKQLTSRELRRVYSALNASANLCKAISTNIHQSDSEEETCRRNRARCHARSLNQLSRWELRRVDSALNAAANLCDSTSRDIYASDSESDVSACSRQSLMHKPFTCRCLALALTVLDYLQGKDCKNRRTARCGPQPQAQPQRRSL